MVAAQDWPVILALLMGSVGLLIKTYKSAQTTEPGTVEHVQQLYREGEIDRAELRRRLDVLMDPEAKRIRESVERVSGIGEQTSWDVAAEFRSLEALRRADRERLEEIPNVGPERARAIQERV